MFRPLTFRLIFSFYCLGAAFPAAGQTGTTGKAKSETTAVPAPAAVPRVDRQPLPAAPEDFLLDGTGFFPAETEAALRAELRDFHAVTGVSFYIAVFTYLLDESADGRARRCLETWVKPGEAGVVLAHDKGTGTLSMAGSADKRLPEAKELVRAFALANAALKAVPAGTPSSERLTAGARRLMEVLTDWKTTGTLPASNPPPAPAVAAATAPGNETSPKPEKAASAIPLDRRPGVFLLDDAHVFSATAAVALEERLAKFNKDFDADLFVVTMTYPPEVAGGFPADALREVWLGDRPGGVVIYDRSRPKDLAIAGAAPGGPWITPLRLESIHRDARAAAAGAGDSPAAGIQAAVDLILKKYTDEGVPVRDAAKRVAPSFPPGVLPVVALAFCFGAAGMYFFHRWQERGDRRSRAALKLLPDVDVPHRLGGRYGGGVVAEIKSGK